MGGWGCFLLGLKLIRENKISVLDKALVCRHDILRHIEIPIVAHDGIQDPEEVFGPLGLEFPGDLSNSLYGFCAGYVAREHHVKIVQVRLLQPLPKVRYLPRGDSCPLELPIASVIAYFGSAHLFVKLISSTEPYLR